MHKLKIYLDDKRPLPDGWDLLIRNPKYCKDIIKTFNGKIDAISLDHDLGCSVTGYDIAVFIELGANDGWLHPIPILICHSSNPIGKMRIEMAFTKARQLWLNRKKK